MLLVPRAGVEPARPFGQRILSPQRLPFRHPGTNSENSMLRDDFEIYPACGRGVLIARQLVRDDQLKNVFTGSHIST